MLTYWIPSLPNKYFTSLLLKRSFICMCTSLSLFLLYRVGWIWGRGSSFGWLWYKTYRQSSCWLLKKFSMLWFFFFYKLYNTNLSLTLQQNYFYNKVMFFHWKKKIITSSVCLPNFKFPELSSNKPKFFSYATSGFQSGSDDRNSCSTGRGRVCPQTAWSWGRTPWIR